jgi:hypothetical protein
MTIHHRFVVPAILVALTFSAAGCRSSDSPANPKTSAAATSDAPAAQSAEVASLEDDARVMVAAFDKGLDNLGAYPSNINKKESLADSLGVTLSDGNYVESYRLAEGGESYVFTLANTFTGDAVAYDSDTDKTTVAPKKN